MLPAEDGSLRRQDAYFSADVETDGPIPGPYSMLSFALVYGGSFDGEHFSRPSDTRHFYAELKPISNEFQVDALHVNQLDRDRLAIEGEGTGSGDAQSGRMGARCSPGYSPDTRRLSA